MTKKKEKEKMRKLHWSHKVGGGYRLILESVDGKVHVFGSNDLRKWENLKYFLRVFVRMKIVGEDEEMDGVSYAIRQPGGHFWIEGVPTIKKARTWIRMAGHSSLGNYEIVVKVEPIIVGGDVVVAWVYRDHSL